MWRGEPGARALVDEQSTGRVLENLFGNAAKYAPAGTAVTVSAAVEGGTVDKFIGDAVMAFWGAPRPDGDQAIHACRAALSIASAVAGHRVRWEGVTWRG